MASAVDRVFAIPELLEKILEACCNDSKNRLDGDHSPNLSLFQLQRVSKQFRNSIAGSVRLRRHMHLEYDASSISSTIFMARKVRALVDSLGLKCWHIGKKNTETLELVFNLHDPYINYERVNSTRKHPPTYDASTSGSWRELKLTSYPVSLCIHIKNGNNFGRPMEVIDFEVGATLGQVIDKVDHVRKGTGWKGRDDFSLIWDADGLCSDYERPGDQSEYFSYSPSNWKEFSQTVDHDEYNQQNYDIFFLPRSCREGHESHEEYLARIAYVDRTTGKKARVKFPREYGQYDFGRA